MRVDATHDYQSVTESSASMHTSNHKGLTTSTTSIRDITGILEKCSLFRSKRWGNPVGPSCSKLFLGNVDVQGVGLGINSDDIPILNESDRTSNLSFRYNMSNDESVGSASLALSLHASPEDIPSTESTVGQTSDIVTKTGTHDQTCGLEHLGHT